MYEHASCELLITGKCNLSCSYCIARELPAQHMDRDVGSRAAHLFMYLAEGVSSIEVTFTGGEPLLQFPLLETLARCFRILAQERGAVAAFVVKTNGTIVNADILKFLRSNDVKCVVSLDGVAAVHNANRVNAMGRGTHDTVIGNIRTMIANNVRCIGSITVHPRFAGRVVANVQYLYDIGLTEMSLGPAYGTVVWSLSDIDSFMEALNGVADVMHNVRERKDYLEVGPIYRQSEHINAQLCDRWGCEAGASNLAFLPDGRIAGCSALAMLIPKFPTLVIGDVWRGIDDAALAHLMGATQAALRERRSCQQCDAATNCTGGCLAINFASTGRALCPPEFYCRTISSIPSAWRRAWE